MKAVPGRVLAPDAPLVSDAKHCYPPVAVVPGIPHRSFDAFAAERVRGGGHVQTVNSRHSRL